MTRCTFAMLACGLALATCVHADEAPSPTAPPGQDKSAKTGLLETGAAALQAHGPVKGFDIHLVGFHPMKDKPEQQMEAHHYCNQVNEDFAQCVLFDGDSEKANLNGIEYIVSEKVFQSLPAEEKAFWHPHNGEILSGQLTAPGIPERAEKELMRGKMNSYGKTWHVWHTGAEGHPGDALPLGEPMLAWSFNRDGELQPDLMKAHERRTGRPVDALRRERADLEALARPQSGVDALKGRFGRETQDIPGVVDENAARQP